MNNINAISEEYVWEILGSVMDPEIPKISVVDLGMITHVSVSDRNDILVKMTPTFAACPAINVLKLNIFNAVDSIPGRNSADVQVTYDISWDTNRITEKGRQILKEFGLAPPEKHQGDVCMKMLQEVECPHCDSKNTSFQSTFGSTLCRAIHYCNDCKQSFEQFKPL